MAIDRLNKARIPLHIKNVMNTDSPGTVVMPSDTGRSANGAVAVDGAQDDLSQLSGDLCIRATIKDDDEARPGKWPTAVTVKNPIFVANIISNQKNKGHKFLAKLFDRLDHHRLSVDLMTTSVQSVSLAMSADDESGLLLALADLEKFGNVCSRRIFNSTSKTDVPTTGQHHQR